MEKSRPIAHMAEDIKTDDAAYRKLVEDVGSAILGIQELCRQHGIFDGLREFLQCWKCGLKESVAFDGRLMTYYDIGNPVDTGLRFPEPDDDGYSRCPGCGEVVRLEERDENWEEVE